ncbi:MAG: YggS family pyridoxal phosphate-dependent enzyme [Planctomycetes bacterium]|nr:YggS family pyridoxal phosphate-dependent enzyme [Planctomycetota bacterium]
MATRISGPSQLRDAYRKVMDNIARAATKSGRRPTDVMLVAVTKNASPDQIRTIVELGQIDLGENRVQHLQQRVAVLEEFLSRRRTMGSPTGKQTDAPAKVRWHMIGHLQRNKIKQVIPLVHLIHSVDSLRLAEELHTFAARTERPIEVLLQVNVSGEGNKFGVAPPAVIHLAEQIDSMIHLRLRGLMTMAPYSDNPEDSRPIFARTAELFEDVRSAKIGGGEFNILSMGMTNDYEIAIAEGANIVRVGRAIFGENEPPEPEQVRGGPEDEEDED